MQWLALAWEEVRDWAPEALAASALAVSLGGIIWVLMAKRNSTSAVAWTMLMVFLPFLGFLFFVLFGYQHVSRPLKRVRRHRKLYSRPVLPADYGKAVQPYVETDEAGEISALPSAARPLARMASRLGASPATCGNHVDFYFDGPPAFEAMFRAIEGARRHIHLEFFIFQEDPFARSMLDALARASKRGVEVRLLYDAMGSYFLSQRFLADFHRAGGKSSVFLPLNPLRRRFQVNLRNHRKLLIVDGGVGFVGGLNVGREYMGQDPMFGYWRDSHLRVEGPAACDLQRVFCQDWDFATGETISDEEKNHAKLYFVPGPADGPVTMQVVDSGPDQEIKSIREVTFAAIVQARKRAWFASPYFVPDDGLLDALRLACYRGVDVRLVHQLYPDKQTPQYAARYYYPAIMDAGAKIYQYRRGMMHAKQFLVDDAVCSVGSANFDNRSMHLNFEASCLMYGRDAVEQIESSFFRDFDDSVLLRKEVFDARPFAGRLLENAARLLSPVL